MLHLYSGPDESCWQQKMPSGVEYLGVDLLQGQDMLNQDTMAYLLEIAMGGKIIAFLAFTLAGRYRCVGIVRLAIEDRCPRPVRSRHGQERWGFNDNTLMEKHLCATDNQLLLRALLLGYLAKEANSNMESCFETPEDPMEYKKDGVEYPSFTAWPEVKLILEQLMGLQRVSVDQGALKHPRRKPTCLWTSMPMVKQLHGLRDTLQRGAWPEDLDAALRLSRSTA